MFCRNFTPFPFLQFESRDVQKRDFGIIVVRGTFQIQNRQPLVLAPEPEPLILSDVYHDKPGQSSLHFENNLAPYKPKTDIHIHAIAQVPEPEYYWRVSAQIGQVQKSFTVCGPWYWQHHMLGGWKLTEPEKCTQVPILYEYAYGGHWELPKASDFCVYNPIGRGFVNKPAIDTTQLVPAPQILSSYDIIKQLGPSYKIEGLGPLSPHWQPRLQHAGTFDTIWEKTRWPDLPEDFKFDFYNSAHPDLIYPGFVEGNEVIRLVNLSPIADLNFTLPGYTLALLIRWQEGQMVPTLMRLDTIHLELPEMKAYLVWRGLFPLVKPIRAVEIRLKMPAHSTQKQRKK